MVNLQEKSRKSTNLQINKSQTDGEQKYYSLGRGRERSDGDAPDSVSRSILHQHLQLCQIMKKVAKSAPHTIHYKLSNKRDHVNMKRSRIL